MKKSILFLILAIILFFPTKVYANTTSIEVSVEGKIKSGEDINILVNMKGLDSLYAASVDFSYDKNHLDIISITAGDTIKKYKDEIMEIGGEVDNDKNRTSYSFTFLGDKKGIDGNGTLAIINAKVLNDNIEIGQDIMKVKLVKRVKDSVDNYSYNFIGYSNEINTVNQQEGSTNEDSKDDNTSTENSSTGNNVEISKSNSVNNDDSYSDISNKNDGTLGNEKDKNKDGIPAISEDKDKVESISEGSVNKEDKTLYSKSSDSNISNKSYSSLGYIQILVVILVSGIIGGSYYYFKVREVKTRDE